MAHKIQTTSKSLIRKIDAYNKGLKKLVDFNQQRNLREMELSGLRLNQEAWATKKKALETEIASAQTRLESIARVIESLKKEKARTEALDIWAKKAATDKLNAAYEMFYNETITKNKLTHDYESIANQHRMVDYDIKVAEEAVNNLNSAISQLLEILNKTLKEIEIATGRNLGSSKFVKGITTSVVPATIAPIEIE